MAALCCFAGRWVRDPLHTGTVPRKASPDASLSMNASREASARTRAKPGRVISAASRLSRCQTAVDLNGRSEVDRSALAKVDRRETFLANLHCNPYSVL